jgi:hypothetical protein
VRIICTKGKREQNVKAYYEFGNDPMKIMCFKHKIRMKVNRKIKRLKLCRIVLFSHKL